MKEKINNFLITPYYILTLAIITIISWTFNLQLYGLIIICFLFIYNLLANKDTSPILPLIMFSSIIYSTSFKYININLLLWILTPIIIFSFIFYFIKNKTKLKKGKYFYGLLIAAIGLSLGGLFYDKLFTHFLTVSLLSFLIVFLYVFFYSTSNIDNFKKILLNTFLGVVFIVLSQIIIYYIKSDNYLHDLLTKNINLGWGNSNNAAFLLNILLPVAFLLSIKSKYSCLFLFLAFLQMLGIIFTLSRGNFVVGSIFFVLLSIIGLKNTKYKVNYIICLGVILLTSIILIFSNIESINIIKERLISYGLDDNGRFSLWQKGVNDFLISPIFGVGFYKDFITVDNLPLLYHNTIFQIIASLGLFGALSFILFFVQRYTIPFINYNTSNLFMFAIILISALYGLIDGNFTFIYNAFIVIFTYIVIEREKDTYNLFRKLKNTQKQKTAIN